MIKRLYTIWLTIACCLLTASVSHAQDTKYIRVEEEKNLTYRNGVGGVHFFSGEILEVVNDDDVGKVVKWADSTLLVPYGKATNKTVNYTKISESEAENTTAMLAEYDQVKRGIMDGLSLSVSGGDSTLTMDLSGLDQALGKSIRVDLASNSRAKISAEITRNVSGQINGFSFPLRVVPAGYPTFWVSRDELQGGIATAAAEQTPVRASEERQQETSRTAKQMGPEEESDIMSWLPWLLFGLALAAAAFFAYPFFLGKYDASKQRQENILDRQKQILAILEGSDSKGDDGDRRLNRFQGEKLIAAANTDFDNLKKEKAAVQTKLDEQEGQNKTLSEQLNNVKTERDETNLKLSAATASLESFRDRVLVFPSDKAKAFAENHLKVIDDALGVYDELKKMALQAARAEGNAAAGVLAAIVGKDNIEQQANNLREYRVDLNRLAGTGVWTRPDDVNRLKAHKNADESLEYLRRNLVAQVVAPFLNHLLIMMEEAGRLKEITGNPNGLSARTSGLAERGKELRKLAQQMIGVDIDYVPLFADMADYDNIEAVPKQPADYLAGVNIPTHHIRQVISYGQRHGDINKKTEVIVHV